MLFPNLLPDLELGFQVIAAIALVVGGIFLVIATPAAFPPLRYVGIIAIGAGILYGTLLAGEGIGRQQCHDEKLQSQINAQAKSLSVWEGGEAKANKLEDDLERETQTTETTANAFARKNAARAPCALTADDLSGLRSIR